MVLEYRIASVHCAYKMSLALVANAKIALVPF